MLSHDRWLSQFVALTASDSLVNELRCPPRPTHSFERKRSGKPERYSSVSGRTTASSRAPRCLAWRVVFRPTNLPRCQSCRENPSNFRASPIGASRNGQLQPQRVVDPHVLGAPIRASPCFEALDRSAQRALVDVRVKWMRLIDCSARWLRPASRTCRRRVGALSTPPDCLQEVDDDLGVAFGILVPGPHVAAVRQRVEFDEVWTGGGE